jgi:sugar phosphate isomerase/epimerase
MKFGTCNEMFEGWDLERQFRFLAETGYQGIEIAPFTIAKSVTEVPAARRREIASLARSTGVEVTGLHWLLVGPEGMHITHPDEATRRRTVDYLKELMRFCADVEGKVLVFGSPKQRAVMEGVTRDQARAYLIEGFSEALSVAEEVGVTLCLEPLPGPDANFILNVNEAVDVIDAVNHPNLRLILDVKSMYGESQISHEAIPDIIRRAGRYVKYVQANDANLGHPGSGEIDFVPIFRALRDIGYDWFVSVETFDFSYGPERIARESLQYLRASYERANEGAK